ncbi:hypothetical protein ACEPAI_6705 [Sanghuangporus weigelae]
MTKTYGIVLLLSSLSFVAAQLNSATQSAGKPYFGTAKRRRLWADNTTNAMKWDATEPSRGQFLFSSADQIVSLANTNGQILRGHTCVWHRTMMDQCVRASSTIQWGTDFLNVAFNAARSADPSTKLYINDYNIEGSGSKSSAMVNSVRSLKSAGVPIEGVGLQGHFIVESSPLNIAGTIQAYANLGVEVAITELDICMTLPADDQKLQQQATDYQTVIEACNSVQACVGMTIWDFTDKYSWVPDIFPGQCAACPWDENLNKKPAYDGILARWSV